MNIAEGEGIVDGLSATTLLGKDLSDQPSRGGLACEIRYLLESTFMYSDVQSKISLFSNFLIKT